MASPLAPLKELTPDTPMGNVPWAETLKAGLDKALSNTLGRTVVHCQEHGVCKNDTLVRLGVFCLGDIIHW